MRAATEATEVLTLVDGVPCRVWTALTEKGTPFFLLVHRVVAHVSLDQAEFEKELRSMPAPTHLPLDKALDMSLFESWREAAALE